MTGSRKIRVITKGPTVDEILHAMIVLELIKYTKNLPELAFDFDTYINQLWYKDHLELHARSIKELPDGRVRLSGRSSNGFPSIPEEAKELHVGEYEYHTRLMAMGYHEVEILYQPEGGPNKEGEGKIEKYDWVSCFPLKK